MTVHNATTEEWDNIVRNTISATFFHSEQWHKVWYNAGYYRGYVAKLFTYKENIALLPLSYKGMKMLFRRKYYSSPQGTYGGFLSTQKMEKEFISKLYKWCKNNKVKNYSNPYLEASNSSESHTYIIHRNENSFEKIIANWHPKHRYKLRKGLKSGHQIVLGEKYDYWEKYYEVYLSNVIRRGSSSSNNYSKKLFDEIFALSPQSRKLFLTVKEGNVVGGGLYFYDNHRIYHWHSCFTLEARNAEAPIHLYYEMIRELNKSKKTSLDLLPSGGHKGVDLFKSRFGVSKTSF